MIAKILKALWCLWIGVEVLALAGFIVGLFRKPRPTQNTDEAGLPGKDEQANVPLPVLDAPHAQVRALDCHVAQRRGAA